MERLIKKVKELREQKYRVVDISQTLGISEKTVIEYNKIPLEDKEKYNYISTSELKSQSIQENKWQLIKQVQEEYQKVHKYSVVARKYNIDDRTVKKLYEKSMQQRSESGNINLVIDNKSKVYHTENCIIPNKINPKYIKEITTKEKIIKDEGYTKCKECFK